MAYGRASNSRYPQCDSYFVEDELEDRLYSCKDFKEDPVAAGRCQEEKRLELTMLTREYYNDILAHMEYMEVNLAWTLSVHVLFSIHLTFR